MNRPRSCIKTATVIIICALVTAGSAAAWDTNQVRALINSVTATQGKMAGAEMKARGAQTVVAGLLERNGYNLPAAGDARDDRIGELAQDPAVVSKVRSNLTAADRRELEEAQGDLTAAERIAHDVLDEVDTLAPKIIDAGMWIASEMLSGRSGGLSELTEGLSDATDKINKTKNTGEKVLDIVGKLLPFLGLLL